MKKLLLILLLIPFGVKAQSIDLYYGKECPFCQKEEKCLKVLKYQLKDNLKINKYEVWHNKKNNNLLTEVRNKFNDKETGVPYTVIGSKFYNGYNDEIFDKIENNILTDIKNSDGIIFPLIGKVNDDSVSKVSFLSGLSDGINLNSLWIILFISGIMLCIYNNKKRLILSNVFLFSSFITYMIFIFSNFELSINQTVIMRSVLAFCCILTGCVGIDSYLKINEPKKSILQIFDEKFGKKRMLFYTLEIILIGVLVTFSLINSAKSTPLLLKLFIERQNSSNLNLILYGLGYLITSLIILNVVNLIIKEIIMENTIGIYSRLISFIIMLICAILILYVPSIFMMV